MLAKSGQNAGVLMMHRLRVEAVQRAPSIFLRNKPTFLLVCHFQKQQIRQLLNIVWVRESIVS